MICFLITDQLQVTLCYQIFTEYGTLNAGTHHQTKKTVASMASAIPGIEANLAACDTASSVIEAALAATCSLDSLSSPTMAGPGSYHDCPPDGIPSELDEKFYTGHDGPRHLWTNFKVTLFGHRIRSWQHQSSHAFEKVSSGSRASCECNIQLYKPGLAIHT